MIVRVFEQLNKKDYELEKNIGDEWGQCGESWISLIHGI